MVTQIVLVEEPLDLSAALAIPGVSEAHAIVEGAAFRTVLILRGPTEEFLLETLSRLPAGPKTLLPVNASKSALDPQFLA